MDIQLSDHFTYKKLLRFTLPSIATMIFTSIYGVVDGFFVSNFVGKSSFAAINFILPFITILGAVNIMFGTGGSALISKTMGEGDMAKANRFFSMLTYISLGLGSVIAVLGILFIRPITAWLGAAGAMLDDCVIYGRIILAVLPAYMLQQEFQSFFVTAEKPQLGLIASVSAGVANMVLDALLVAGFRCGIIGAAVATATSQLIGGLFPILYFSHPNTSLLRLTRASFDGMAFLKTCTNGCSELISHISMSLVGILYNVQLMKYVGEDGVAAYGVLMYVSMIFVGAFIGYSIGTAPVVGYHYGAQNHGELKSLLKKSLVIIGAFSVGMLLLGETLARPLSLVFVGYDTGLLALTLRAFAIFSFSFLFAGFPIYGSSFFTALNNGLVSLLIASLRTLVFQIAAILILPVIWKVDGIWISLIVGELLATVVTVIFLVSMKKKYHY